MVKYTSMYTYVKREREREEEEKETIYRYKEMLLRKVNGK